jgi:hypothetical protein
MVLLVARGRWLLQILSRALINLLRFSGILHSLETNADFGIGYDTRPQTSQLITLIILQYVRFDVFTAVTMNNVVFWDIKISCTSEETH